MQPDDALNEAALDRELRRALSVEPSPEFVARVRMRIANEPARMPWRASWLFAVSAIAIVVVAAIVVQWARRAPASIATPPVLTARAVTPSVGTLPATDSSVASAFRRTFDRSAKAIALQRDALARPELVEGRVLLDPRESAALRSLIGGVRSGRLDLTPVLRASTPTALDLPAIQDIDIPVITIEPLAPFGAEGVRQ